MNKFLSDSCNNLKPYTPGEQPQDKKYIKLNTNENPYPPSKSVLKGLKEAIDDDLKLYPEPESDFLKDKIASYYDIKTENIFLGNGSDEILALAFMAFYQNSKVVFPEITYSFYPVYANLFKCDVTQIKMNNLKVDTNGFYNQKKGVIIANPNAPTGEFITLDVIEKIAATNKDNVVLIDEAYIDFGGESAIKLITKYNNLLIVQTFSKSRSLAGIRLGMAFGSKEIISGLNMVKNSFNSYPINMITQKGAYKSFEDDKYFKEICNKIIKTREESILQLQEIGLNILPSKANFIFVSSDVINGKQLYLKLKDKGILVRHFDLPIIANYVRITIGTKVQMKELIKAIKLILN